MVLKAIQLFLICKLFLLHLYVKIIKYSSKLNNNLVHSLHFIESPSCEAQYNKCGSLPSLLPPLQWYKKPLDWEHSSSDGH